MGLDSKMEKITHIFRNKDQAYKKDERHQSSLRTTTKKEDELYKQKYSIAKLAELGAGKFQPDEFNLLKPELNMLNNETS